MENASFEQRGRFETKYKSFFKLRKTILFNEGGTSHTN